MGSTQPPPVVTRPVVSVRRPSVFDIHEDRKTPYSPVMCETDSAASSSSQGTHMDIVTPATTAISPVEHQHLPTFDFLDYTEGDTLPLRVDLSENAAQFEASITAHVEKLIEPRTMSCGMMVTIKEAGKHDRRAFLKLFDRRLSQGFREYFNGGECHKWTPTVEEQYMDALRNGGLPTGSKTYEGENMTIDKWNEFSLAQKEHVFQQRMRKINHDELESYRRLVKHQGADVPRLYASVTLGVQPPDTGCPATNERYRNLLEIRGLIIEFLDGWELLSIPSTIAFRTATKLFHESMDIVRMIGAHGVLNFDTKLDNFMVTDDGHGGLRVVMIDLGFCQLRHPQWTNLEWAKLKTLAWEGEMHQVSVDAKNLVRKKFDAKLDLASKSDYGFVVATHATLAKKPPEGWVESQTSKGPAYLNPNDILCTSACCDPIHHDHHHEHSGKVSKIWRRLTHSRKKSK